MDKLQEMSSFVAVVEAGSFVGGGDALGFSKAAISRHISELEQRLGTRLLHRTTRRLSLTDDGQRFFARCKALLATLDDVESEMTSNEGEVTGTLRVNAPLTFGTLHLAPLWGRFLESYPRVSLDVTLVDRVVDLVDEGYDLAVRISDLPSSNLVSRQLASTRMVMCASPGYIAQHGAPATLAELGTRAVIAYSYWATRDEWHFSGPDGAASVRIKPRMHTNNGDTCRLAALNGYGIILQPDFIIGTDLAAGTLVELLPEYRAASIGIHAVYSSRKHMPLKVRRMIDYLAEEFAVPSWQKRSAG
jgi:DNA-binding transcriptional LysR family regulator